MDTEETAHFPSNDAHNFGTIFVYGSKVYGKFWLRNGSGLI